MCQTILSRISTKMFLRLAIFRLGRQSCHCQVCVVCDLMPFLPTIELAVGYLVLSIWMKALIFANHHEFFMKLILNFPELS